MDAVELTIRMNWLLAERRRIEVAEGFGYDRVTMHRMVANAIEIARIGAKISMLEKTA